MALVDMQSIAAYGEDPPLRRGTHDMNTAVNAWAASAPNPAPSRTSSRRGR
jgi:hypothetical protein